MSLTVRVWFSVYELDVQEGWHVENPFAILTIDTLVPVTPDNAKAISYGRWSSDSKLIGYHTSGKYYVKHIHLPREVEMPSDRPRRGFSAMNPVALFFDSQWEDPFMVLYQFSPMEMSGPARGSGLTRFSYEQAVHMTQVMYDIEWDYRYLTRDRPIEAGWEL